MNKRRQNRTQWSRGLFTTIKLMDKFHMDRTPEQDAPTNTLLGYVDYCHVAIVRGTNIYFDAIKSLGYHPTNRIPHLDWKQYKFSMIPLDYLQDILDTGRKQGCDHVVIGIDDDKPCVLIMDDMTAMIAPRLPGELLEVPTQARTDLEILTYREAKKDENPTTEGTGKGTGTEHEGFDGKQETERDTSG